MRLDLLSRLNQERRHRRAAVLVTDLAGGDQRLVTQDETAADPLGTALAERLRMGRSGLIEHEGRRLFLTVQVPPVRLVIVGAVHIAQSLAPMARLVGFDVTVVDPRTAFAT
ncbi:MAG: XdhC family protein, partial [Parafilimonas terrae]|nr:XdhC family protein [Parafilimonas terrae]